VVTLTERPVAEVTIPAPGEAGHHAATVERALRGVTWPQACACCGDTNTLGSIPVYFNVTLGRNAILDIPYCRRCQSHRYPASHTAFASATKGFMIGLTILLIAFLGGMLADPIVGLLLQVLLVIGAIAWGVRRYFAARVEIRNAMTSSCTAGQTPAVRFVSARSSGWRFRFSNQSYAEQFAAGNPGATVTSLDLEMPRDWTGRI